MDFSSHYCWASVTFSLFHCLSVTSAHFLCQRVTLAQQLKMQSSQFLHTSMTHSDRWVTMGKVGTVDSIAVFSGSLLSYFSESFCIHHIYCCIGIVCYLFVHGAWM